MVDFENAFDSVACSFVNKCLTKFDFGQGMQRWISALYYNMESCVHVNGQYSVVQYPERYKTGWSVVSIIIFDFDRKFDFDLSIMIRQNDTNRDIQLADEETLVSQFDDDTTFF